MIVSLVIGPGKTVVVPQRGDRFRVYSSPAPLNIRADGQDTFSLFSQQTGVTYPGFFNLLEVQNPMPNTIVCQIFVSSGAALDDTRTLQAQNVVNWPTWGPSGGLIIAPIPDLTGSIFKDVQGNSWLAVQRVSINYQAIGDYESSYDQQYVYVESVAGGAYPFPASITNVATTNTYPGPFISIACSGSFVGASSFTMGTLAQVSLFEIYQAIFSP